jgi:hypothetical protein
MQVGVVHVPLAGTQSAAVAHAEPMLVQLVCVLLHTSGCAALQRVSPGWQAAGSHMPVSELQSAAVAHAEPTFDQPLRPELHVCGCAPLQRTSPVLQVGAVQMPALQSADVAHAGPFA